MSENRPKALVAMSGGVDSSVAAAIMLRQGYDVIGVFMRLGAAGDPVPEQLVPAAEDEACASGPGKKHRGCCSVGDAADARLVAAHLGIPLYVCNFRRDFERVISYFADEYARGRTPNPCVRCNDWLKFGKLHEYARRLGAGVVASGHYARVERSSGGVTLRRGVDLDKDQSYVLFGVDRGSLAGMALPVGGYRKPEIRQLARDFGLPVSEKPDSQEICFVPDDDYASLVERERPETVRRGSFLDPDGNEIARHGGQHRFTIGQRRGVGVALGYPVYVVAKDPGANTVTIGPRDMLLASGCIAAEANWLVETAQASTGWTPCFARFRAHGADVPARFRVPAPDDSRAAGPDTPSGRRGVFEVEFDEPQEAVAPGQAVVIYDADDADLVLGGGWIATTIPVERQPAITALAK